MKLGPFYIIQDKLYPAFDDGIGHADFFPTLVRRVFSGRLDQESLDELSECIYGFARGRVTLSEGKPTIFGTTGCEPFIDELRLAYRLVGVEVVIRVGRGQDDHYKSDKAQERVARSIMLGASL